MPIIIVGAGVGGLTLALWLHRKGIECQVFEAARVIESLGVGINLLPHAMKEMTELDLDASLIAAGVPTRDMCFHNRFGQHIYSEARGQFAGYQWPQVSLHRGVLQRLLLDAVTDRLGRDAVQLGMRFVGADQTTSGVRARFAQAGPAPASTTVTGEILIGCDGIRSAVRRQLHPHGDELLYSGITMWRGVTQWAPILTGASMVYAGWLETGKLIAYPISDVRDDQGRQAINWLVEFYVPPRHASGDWSAPGELEDFLWACADMHFDWLDVPAFVQAADFVYEYPMVDRDPLPFWTNGRITLLGDAAHPMYPRGSNGAGQAIVDARALGDALSAERDWPTALARYESLRRPATSKVVLANRSNPPDAILREVYERTGDRPFENINDVISAAELAELSAQYKRVAGFDQATLASGQR